MDFTGMNPLLGSGAQETHSGNTSGQSPHLELHPGHDSDISNQKGDGTSSRPCAASQRHIRTEQKRRDRINDGFVALQALLPGKEKVEKAVMLTQAADYIKQMQGLMTQVLACGASKALPNELQWNLRMLLPRKPEMPTAPAPAIPSPQPPPSNHYQDNVSANTNNSSGNNQGRGMNQAPASVVNSIPPVVTAPVVNGPQYGLQFSQPQNQQMNMGNMGINISQGQLQPSEPAAGGNGGGGLGQGSGGMLIADPATLSQLQALVQQQQAAQGWHNASHLLQALQVQQQLQQAPAGNNHGITVTPQMLQQLTGGGQNQGMSQVMYQPQAPTHVSMGVPVNSNGMHHSHMPVSMGNTAPMMSAPQAPIAPQGTSSYPQAPQPSFNFPSAANSAFSSLAFPNSTSAFQPAGSANLSGLHQLMEAAHASDEERDGSYEMRSPKRPRCYSTGPPKMAKMAKAGILV